MLPSKLTPAQVVLLGVRDLDADERSYIEKHFIKTVCVSDMELDPETVTDIACSKGSANLYIHIDLDVLEPSQFPHVQLPAPDGLNLDTLQKLIKTLNTKFNVVGFGLVGYTPAGKRRFELFENIAGIGANLYYR